MTNDNSLHLRRRHSRPCCEGSSLIAPWRRVQPVLRQSSFVGFPWFSAAVQTALKASTDRRPPAARARSVASTACAASSVCGSVFAVFVQLLRAVLLSQLALQAISRLRMSVIISAVATLLLVPSALRSCRHGSQECCISLSLMTLHCHPNSHVLKASLEL